MNKTTNDYLVFLNEQYKDLTKVKQFLSGVPKLLTSGMINQMEFQNFLEKYEMESAGLLFEENRLKQALADGLRIKPQQVSFKLLVKIGHREFEEIGRRVLRITNEIKMLMMKVAVYLKSFTRLQQEMASLNNFLYQEDYSARGVERPYTPGRRFYGEA
ncbi:MAG: hypothetical protein GY765_03705 [bacterium]|nr:hypothetical protein [bacterium]